MTDPIVVTEKLSYLYRSGPREAVALSEIDLEIARGSCVAVIGVTGSGKSTLVQQFNGLLTPTSGRVVVDGIDVKARGVDLVALRRRVGMLFQFPEAQLFESTLFEEVAFGPRRMKLGKGEVRSRVRAALELVGLPFEQYARRSPFELSGGQMRRAALASVLAMEPVLLVLDEATAGLDAEGREEFYSYLRRVREGRDVTVVLVSHDMAEVASLADRLLLLHQGRLVMQGTPRELFSRGGAVRGWGLAVPPLVELLALLRGHGVEIPAEVFTLEEATNALTDSR